MKNRIRELRQSRGIKQSELAKYLGIAQNTLSYWEQGKYDVDNSSLQKIADFFKCTVDYVLCRDKSSESFFTLSEKEKEVILAYRARSDMQSAVDTLLGVNSISNIASDSSSVVSKWENIFGTVRTEPK